MLERDFGKGGREQAHGGKIVRESMDCKCKCIVVTNIRGSYLGFGLEVGGRREAEKSREREREGKETVNKRSYEASF